MGTPLIDGDIEDLDGIACVVCPAHLYHIDMATGKKVDTDLCGHACSSADQKQRMYNAHRDGEHIWVDIPPHRGAPLPSDYYNQVQNRIEDHQYGLSGSQGYGLFGAPPPQQPPGSPLQPYAGVRGYPAVPGVAASGEEPPLILSQSTGMTPPPSAKEASQHAQQGRINFPAVKADSPFVARRKAATAAIMAKSYRPPTSDSAMQSPVKMAEDAMPAAVAAPRLAVQKTLFESWGTGPSNSKMDLN